MADLLTAFRLLLIIPVGGAILQPALTAGVGVHLGPVAFAWLEGLSALLAPLGLTAPWALLGLLILAVVSDYYDGTVARRLSTASPRGQLFDHGTDCCFVTAGLVCGALIGTVPWLLPLLVAAAFSQYVLDSRFLHRQKSLRMSSLGKWNGIFYFVPLFLIAAARLPLPFLSAPQQTMLSDLLQQATTVLCIGLIISTGASIVDRALARPSRHD